MTIKINDMMKKSILSAFIFCLWVSMPLSGVAQEHLLTVAEAETQLKAAQEEYKKEKAAVQALPQNKQEEARKTLRETGRKVGYCKVELFKARKRDFLREQAGLTEQEGVRFFPLYEELQTAIFKLHDDAQRTVKRLLRNKDNRKIPDAEYWTAVQNRLDAATKEARLQNEYFEKFKRILPAEKLLRVYDAESRFSFEMMRKQDEKPPHR